jgi:fructose transport system ATP-binding protein
MLLHGQAVEFKRPQDAKAAGIETEYQTLAVAPALDISTNMFLGCERSRTAGHMSVLTSPCRVSTALRC